MRKAQFPIRTSVSLSRDIFEALNERSQENETSLGEEIRHLLYVGLQHSTEGTNYESGSD